MTAKTTWTSADHNDLDKRVSVVETVAGGGSLVSPVTTGTLASPLMFTGVPRFGPASRDGSSVRVKDDTTGFDNVIDWEMLQTVDPGGPGPGYMIHLNGILGQWGSGGSGPFCMGVGVGGGGGGIFINNYESGVGLKITNRETTNNQSSWGFLLSQKSNTAEGMYLSQETSTADMLAKWVSAPIGSVGGAGAATGQIMSEWRRSQAATADTLLIRFAVDAVTFQLPVTVSGSAFIADTVAAKAAGSFLELYDTGGTTNQRRFRWKQSSGHLLVQKVTDASVATTIWDIDQSGNVTPNDGANIILGSTTGTKIGTATTQKLGFYNATPVVQPSGTPAAATDLATVISLANSLRTNLLALGLVA